VTSLPVSASSGNDARARSVPLEVALVLPDGFVEAVAQRVAELLRVEQRPSEFLTVAEAAELLRARPQRVYDLLSSRRLTRFKDGSRVLVSRAEIVAHLLPPDSPGRMSSGVAA